MTELSIKNKQQCTLLWNIAKVVIWAQSSVQQKKQKTIWMSMLSGKYSRKLFRLFIFAIIDHKVKFCIVISNLPIYLLTKIKLLNWAILA